MPMRMAYMCLATDIITLYALGRSWNRLDAPDYSRVWVETVKATIYVGHFLKQFPFIHTVVDALPFWLVGAIHPGMLMILQWRKVGSPCGMTYK